MPTRGSLKYEAGRPGVNRKTGVGRQGAAASGGQLRRSAATRKGFLLRGGISARIRLDGIEGHRTGWARWGLELAAWGLEFDS
jgi:hypothetical protein